jgi:hypothetical protein
VIAIFARVEAPVAVEVLVGLFERQGQREAARIVEAVQIGALEHHRIVALTDVEMVRLAELRRVRIDVDDVDGVVVEAGVVPVPRDDGVDVDRAGERNGDRLVDAPAVEPVDQTADALLELGGSEHRGVDAQPGTRRGIGAHRDVVRQRDVRQGEVIEVELDRDVGGQRPHQSLGLGTACAHRRRDREGHDRNPTSTRSCHRHGALIPRSPAPGARGRRASRHGRDARIFAPFRRQPRTQ